MNAEENHRDDQDDLDPWYSRTGFNCSEKVQQLRDRLYDAAKADPKRRFYSLRDKIFRKDVLEDAWRKVRKNKGAPGIDRVSVYDVDDAGVDAYLEEIQQQLKDGSYRASSLRRVYIDKPDGGKRALSIPTVKDRIVQGAARIVLEPIFEADFRDCSFSYREGIGCQDAREEIYKWLNFGCENIIETDIKAFFDNVPHDKLMAEVKRRIADRWVLKLIQAWLWAKIVDAKTNHSWKPKKGLPQGGVISPLLSNVYLNQLDTAWETSSISDKRGGDAHLVRYADDLAIATSKETDRPLRLLRWMIKRLGLELHPDKTHVVTAEKGFDFLGYRFVRRFSRKHGKKKTYIFPSRKSMGRARGRICELTNKRKHHNKQPLEVVAALNRFLVGWSNYHKGCNATRAFHRLQRFVFRHIRKYLTFRRHLKGFREKEYPDSFLIKELGLYDLTGGIISYVGL